MCWLNLKFIALPVREIIAIGVLGGVQTPILEKKGSGIVRSYHSKERALHGEFLPIGSPY